MRDFFIRGFEAILSILLIIGAIVIVIAAGAAAFGGAQVGGATGMQGPVAGLAILIVGFVGLLIYGGLLYLGLGIYHNTRRTAEALEARGGRV